MQKVSVLITDIDNTLYDWVDMWYQSFHTLFNQLVIESGTDPDTLEAEINAVFRTYRTLEYRFLIHELPVLRTHCPEANILKKYAHLILAHRHACESGLRLYPSVWETLVRLKETGCLLIAFTGSKAYYAAQRINVLGLDGLFDYVYSPPDPALPPAITQEETLHPASALYTLHHSIHRPLAPGRRKPDPEALLAIIQHVQATPDQVIYVGDSLTRDIIMAQQAHVTDIYAEYGRVRPTRAYEFLRRFSHWSTEDLQSEWALNPHDDIHPTYVLTQTFAEILTCFDFVPYVGSVSK